MAIRIKLATLFSFIATVFLIIVQAATDYSSMELKSLIENLPRESVKYLATFIFLAALNYLITGPIVKPLLMIINKVDNATKGKVELDDRFNGDEIRMLERGLERITNTIQHQDEQIDHIHAELVQKKEDLSTLFKNTITALAKAVYARDPYTALHSRNVMRYARALSKKLQLPESDIYYLEIGALLHDIGKIGVPEHVLMKSGKLTDTELDAIRLHPEYGYQIIKEIEELKCKGVHDIVLHHHERMDGKGYPKGLKGKEIPLQARIVSICDAFDAMTTSRSYRQALGVETAIEQLKKNSGDQFDSDIVEAFIKCLEEDPTLYMEQEVFPENMLASS
ncbi:HD-GYP domain-containing protein [Paenibacillus oralis]|uniref:HD-GYP domain-containing protein n=1 Tax=Paenibacillus oralis TaxID=2490856 RepID=A0A3P3T9W7_9BACL|nr:HD-GYP domain-containing protein [Paenibacillus oralis]RRJ54826.1 HD-GYP domain-containing protein [Paenibacillus oralis]